MAADSPATGIRAGAESAASTGDSKRPVRYRVAGGTTIGLEPSRSANEDAYAYLTGYLAGEEGGQAWAMLCVADGMGGMAAGEVASEAAVGAIAGKAALLVGRTRPPANEQAALVQAWILAAHEEVRAALDPIHAHGGCALLCACLIDRRLTMAHVGDCRLYLVRNDEVDLLSRDHSAAMERCLREKIAPDELRADPERAVLTRSLGGAWPPEVDTLVAVGGSPSRDLESGDVLILCSDGLWEPVRESELPAIVRRAGGNLQRAADLMLALALRRDAPDNATVLLLRLDEGAHR